MKEDIAKHIAGHGVKPTANRIMIASALADAVRPMSMGELEEVLETIDKSVISRTLTLFKEARLVHVLEDGSEGVRYELCHSASDEHDEDAHVHFHCDRCGRTFCLEDIPVPEVPVPRGYLPRTANFIIKGICPECSGASDLHL